LSASREVEKERAEALKAERDIKGLMAELTGENAPPGEDKFESMSKKQIVDTLVSAIETKDAAQQQVIMDAIQQAQKVNDPKLEALTKGLMAVMAKLSVTETRNKFPDFDAHRQDIASVLNEYPTMNPADAYLLAKSRKAGDMPPVSELDTEKPGAVDLTVRMPQRGMPSMTEDEMASVANRGRQARSPSVTRGVQSFRSLIDAAAEKVVTDRK
jgi:hypothetical protein